MRRTIVLTAVVLSLSLGGGAYAVSRIGPEDIKRSAVRSLDSRLSTLVSFIAVLARGRS